MNLSGKRGSVRERVTNNLFSAQSGTNFSGQKGKSANIWSTSEGRALLVRSSLENQNIYGHL